MKKPTLTLLSIFLLTLLSLSIQANQNSVTSEYQSHDEIYQLVTEHVKQKADQKIFELEIQTRKLSLKLKLPQCQNQLQLNDRNPNKITGRMTVGVSCLLPKWQIYVPVTVKGKLPTVVTTKGILKLAVIKPEDVEIVLKPYNKRPKGSMANIATVVGMRSTKAIPPNSILKIRNLQAPFWVFKGQEVDIITKIGSIIVKTKGVALASGVEQQQVAVKNLNSRKVIKGIVIAPNTVQVP